MATESESLSYYVKEYARYILPIWLFPLYVFAFGFVCEHFKIEGVGQWFMLLVLPIFAGTFLWSRIPKIPYWKHVFLTIIIPFLIFAGIGSILAIVDVARKGTE
ncbi:MAG: hypothetical protein ABI925_04955 [Verrucomicrobiota bacterium]